MSVNGNVSISTLLKERRFKKYAELVFFWGFFGGGGCLHCDYTVLLSQFGRQEVDPSVGLRR